MLCFKDIIEQKQAINELQHALAHNRLNHSYLFEGIAGIGRMSLAKALAARYLCMDPIDNDACGSCKSCKMLSADTHPDYLELPRDCRELRIRRFVERDGGTEKVEHQPILTFVRLKPMIGNKRVCIIPDAERMTIESANTFLKTLEEPPEGTLIILTCSARDKLLGTIVSRCRRVALSPLPENVVRNYLLQHSDISPNKADSITALAAGSIAQAMALCSGDIVEDWQWLNSALNERSAVGAVDLGNGIASKVKLCKDGESKRQEALKFFDMLALWLRQGLRSGVSPHAAYSALDALWEAGERLRANVRPELVVYNAALSTMSALINK